MSDISVISSLYKTEKFLAQYTQNAQKIACEIKAADLELEFVIIANAASDEERRLLTTFEQAIRADDSAKVQIHYVALETLYASWNRGIAAADSDILGFWNVDDTRTSLGLIEAHQLLSQGTDLVDFAFQFQTKDKIETRPVNYNPEAIHPKTGVGPFFMLHRRLYDSAGAFNKHFRITGDFEFSTRDKVRQSQVALSDTIAGVFVLHGENLSGGFHPHEWIEFNMALMIHNRFELLRPVDPIPMRERWDSMGDTSRVIPDEVQEWLWGAGAQNRYERFRWERKLPPIARRVLFALAKRGLIHSVDWDSQHQSP